MKKSGWSDWIRFDRRNRVRIPEHACFGVYRNRLVDGLGKPIPIKHPIGVDKDGVVYIGAAGVLTRYPGKPHMRMRFDLHVAAHKAGKGRFAKDRRLVRLWEKIESRDPHAVMEFQYLPLESPEQAVALEAETQREFRSQFGVDPDDLWCNESLHQSPF